MQSVLNIFRFKTFGGRDPHRPPEDIAYSVARFFQKGGSLQNYYMVFLIIFHLMGIELLSCTLSLSGKDFQFLMYHAS